MTDELLKPIDVQKTINAGRTRTYQLIASGQIPSVRISEKIIRVLRSDLDAFIKSRRNSGEACEEAGE